MLLSLLIVPVVVVLYLRIQHRRRALVSGAFQGLASAQTGRKRAPGIRRHLPPALFVLSLAILLFALARPQATVRLPRIEGTVMLVFDVSASMGATDVDPSRLEVAKQAASEFVLSQPATVKIGIVSFSGSGFTIQTPTNDSNALLATINRLKPTAGTAVGDGILTALKAIAIDAGLATDETFAPTEGTPGQGAPDQGGQEAPTPQPSPEGGPSFSGQRELMEQLPEGPYPASVIVLLSDGESNQSIDPLEATQAALAHNVKVHALGFGTTAGTTLELDGYSVHTALDEALLRQVTGETGGVYLPAQSDQDPQQVYASLTPQLVVKPEAMEITAVLAGLGILLLFVGSLLSMLWFSRLV
jgi:Ca-activated chloride channel family protein